VRAIRQDVTLSQQDYERFRDLVLERSGLLFREQKRQMLAKGLAQALEMSASHSLADYYQLLRSTPALHPEWDRLVSLLTVGETYFFRNKGHFDALARHILPEIIAHRERSNRRIRIWSAGCATGEEPYSIAILLHELLPNPARWNILLLATDINRDALRRARDGVYGDWSFRGMDRGLQERYFHPQGTQYAICDEIKAMVTLDYLNLVDDCYPSLSNKTSGMDLILCRNVTIYFSPQVTQQVINRLFDCVAEGGWFIPGASEPNMATYRAFVQQSFPGATTYQKPATAMLAAAPWQLPATPAAPAAAPKEPLELQPPAAPPHRVAAPPPVDLLAEAQALVELGQVEEALDRLYRKLDQDPQHVPAHCLLGKLYANQGNLEEAQRWCERAIGLDRLQPEPYFLLSMIHQANGLVEQAVDALKKTIYLDPAFVLAHYTLGALYQQQGKRPLARRAFQNTRRLLADKPREEIVPAGDGLLVGRLQQLVELALHQNGGPARNSRGGAA
jgi:chemotaxis protein methyltransferase CheR